MQNRPAHNEASVNSPICSCLILGKPKKSLPLVLVWFDMVATFVCINPLTGMGSPVNASSLMMEDGPSWEEGGVCNGLSQGHSGLAYEVYLSPGLRTLYADTFKRHHVAIHLKLLCLRTCYSFFLHPSKFSIGSISFRKSSLIASMFTHPSLEFLSTLSQHSRPCFLPALPTPSQGAASPLPTQRVVLTLPSATKSPMGFFQ